MGGVGLGLMGLTVSAPSLWALWTALVVWAIGVGVLMPAIVAAGMHALPQRPGFASGAGSTARNVGGAAGVAVFAALHDVETGVLMAAAGAAMVAAAVVCIQGQRHRVQSSTVPLTSMKGNGPVAGSRSPLSD